MINAIKHKIFDVFGIDNHRSKKILKNIIFSFGIKAFSIFIGLYIIRLTIDYIDTTKYGIWVTISSITIWVSFFDIGMGNGMRNKLTSAITLNKFDDAKKYVSTTYATLTLIAISFFTLFYLVNPLINWAKFLNVPQNISEDLHLILLIVFGAFSIQFIFQLLNTILTATHEPATANFITLLGQIGVLLTIIFLKQNIKGSLLILVIALNAIPLAILIVASILLFNTKLKYIAPQINKVHFKYIKDIISLGSVFFIIQIGSLVLVQTDNIIIAKVLSPEHVTKFNISYRLFSVITMVFSIILIPYWSAFTDAYAKQDYKWMIKNVQKLRKLWIFFSFIIIPILLLMSNFIYKIWMGNILTIETSLSIAMSIYIIAYLCLIVNCYFLNGVGKLRVQLYAYLITIVINIRKF